MYNYIIILDGNKNINPIYIFIYMKVALCFIISYSHILNKEDIWIEWIEPNKDIINVYFHYKNYNEIQSEWIKKHAIHPKCVVETNYMHVVPAYLTLMNFVLTHDQQNMWLCFLTDSCVPIISPLKFRELFFENYFKTIMSWRKAWWNVNFCNRANLKLLKEDFHLANDPWFVIKREDAIRCMNYSKLNTHIYNLICKGDVANESIFAIILYSANQLNNTVKNEVTHAADWSRMSSATSPHVFKEGDKKDIKFIDDFLKKNKYTMFLRKIDKKFPDSIIKKCFEDNNNLLKRKRKLIYIEYKLKFIYIIQRIMHFKYFSLLSLFAITFFFTKFCMKS
uniref:Uncharacterized protein n=1 Tax=viral metagenome TaxID=1070528 RepID=A0A6C0D8K7_9ZZZZ